MYLLDTHAFLWWMVEPERLPERVRELLRTSPESVAFSAVCAWEIAIKTSIGKLAGVPVDRLEETVSAQGFVSLAFTTAHAVVVAGLPPHHRDPFDRALIGQAIAEHSTLLTSDPRIGEYSIPTLW
jgi:PIN domain nuclease of toxin-antitoxin system